MTDDPQQAIAAHKSAVSGSVGRAAVEAWQREREEACRRRHATAAYMALSPESTWRR